MAMILCALGPVRADDGVQWAVVGRAQKDGGMASWRVATRADGTNATFVPVFRAMTSPTWPPGMVPVFAVESDGRVQLRRLPMKGRENFTSPLFFALPPVEEPDAAALTGRWTLVSRSREGHSHRLAMELTVLGDRVAGRFDQDTDYRFGFITGGTWRSNRLEVAVEYINDRYTLTGARAAGSTGKLDGEWLKKPDEDGGHWEATREVIETGLPDVSDMVPLMEWTRASDGARQYLTGDLNPGPEWERATPPLCRVWPP